MPIPRLEGKHNKTTHQQGEKKPHNKEQPFIPPHPRLGPGLRRNNENNMYESHQKQKAMHSMAF